MLQDWVLEEREREKEKEKGEQQRKEREELPYKYVTSGCLPPFFPQVSSVVCSCS